MNLAETTRLCRAIASLKPAQHFDEETPTFWQLVLADVRYQDAQAAVVALARGKSFIGTDDIVAEVKRIRAARLEGVDRLAHLAETPAEWRQIIARVADGDMEVPPLALDAPQDPRVAAALPGLFKRPERPTAGDYAETPLKAITATVSGVEAARQEAERARQLAALEAMTAEVAS